MKPRAPVIRTLLPFPRHCSPSSLISLAFAVRGAWCSAFTPSFPAFATKVDVALDHHLHELLERYFRRPSQLLSSPSSESASSRFTSAGRRNFGSTFTYFSQSSPAASKASSQNSRTVCVSPVPIYVVVGLLLLQHRPHGLDVVPGKAPVPLRVQVAEPQLVLLPVVDAGHAVRDLACHELDAPARRLVVEEDAAAGVHAEALPVVDGDPVPVELRDRRRGSAGRKASFSFCGVSCTLPNISLEEAW